MIDVSELMEDPDFASSYQVIRQSGKWAAGRFIRNKTEALSYYGPVQPPSAKILEQLPEGDRQKGIMQFWCRMPREFRIAQNGKQEAWASDEIIWAGQRFKCLQLIPWNHAGWMSVLACRVGVDDGTAEPDTGTA